MLKSVLYFSESGSVLADLLVNACKNLVLELLACVYFLSDLLEYLTMNLQFLREQSLNKVG